MPLHAPVAEVLDMDQVAEAELSKLQRAFRIMEGDRSAYSGEASGKLKSQRKLIQILKDEQSNILADLKIASAPAKLKDDKEINQYLDLLLQEYNQTGEIVKTEKAHLTEIDYQIKKMERAVADIKTKAITDQQCQARIIAGQRTVAMLENRLEVAIKKFNIVVAKNFELRAEIDHLLKERAHFNLLWEKLINNLNQGKKFMLDLIEQATIAYDQREEWCNKLAALRSKGNQDLMLHTKEMRALQRKLDHDSNLQDFLGTKGQKRLLTDLEAREARKKQQVKEEMERQLAEYRGTLQQIKDFCGESDVERLAAQFVKQEEENFALFNYVNELNHESESLSYAIEDLKTNIDSQRELNNTREKQQKDTIESLELKLAAEIKEAQTAEKKLAKFDDELNKVLQGNNTIVSEYNVRMYLGLIEKRTTELVQTVYYKERIAAAERSRKAKPVPGIIKPDPMSRYHHNLMESLVPTSPCPLCVETEQVSDIIDSLQFAQNHPMVVNKLQDRLLLPHALDRLHNVSACHLPQSRKIIQQRYQ